MAKPQLMTAAEFADAIGVTRGRVSQMVARGVITRYTRYGRTVMIEASEVDRMKGRKAGRPRSPVPPAQG